MKETFGRLWQEITKILRWILRNKALLKAVMRLGVIIYRLLGYFAK